MSYLKKLKNKYVITLIIFGVYVLFLDDVDVFTIIRQKVKLGKLRHEKELLLDKFHDTKTTLNQLGDKEALERFAREEKFFKRDNEDIFVIVYDEK